MAVDAGAAAEERQSHVVQFYRQDEELTVAVADYLTEAVTAGGAAVLVATPAHRQAIRAGMAAAGVPVDAAERDGRLVCADAEQLLSRFVADGQVDRAAFAESVGRLIRHAARRPLAVYGEMVAVLWAAGEVNAVLEVEELWNDLAREVPSFSLFCGYPDDCLAADPRSRSRVCRLHTAVLGPPPGLQPEEAQPWRAAVSRAFESASDAPRAARHFVLRLIRQWHLDSGHREAAAEHRAWFLTDVGLVVTELATNAVLHARSAFTVSAALTEDGVYLSVADDVPLPGGTCLPVKRDHGLGIISRMTDHWGVRPLPDGKAVWVRLRLPA